MRKQPAIRRRSRRYQICIFLALLVLAISITFKQDDVPDPVFEDRKLSEWVDDLSYISSPSDAHRYERASEAIEALGTNCIPYLATELRMEYSASERFYLHRKGNLGTKFRAENSTPERLYRKTIELLPFAGTEVENESERAGRALMALRLLGENAKGAIPDICEFIQSDNPLSHRGLSVLYSIGGDTDHILIETLDDPSSQNRETAVYYLGKRKSAGRAALPRLRLLLDDPDKDVRSAASKSIAKIESASHP